MKEILVTFLLAGLIYYVGGHEIKAMLYGYLPSDNDFRVDKNESLELSSQIQAYLDNKNIQVTVEVCDLLTTCTYLYNNKQILDLWQQYHIIEIDDMLVSTLIETPAPELLTFTKSEITFYQDVYQFQWTPLKRKDGLFFGSPGMICSDFILWKSDGEQRVNNQMINGFKSHFHLSLLYASFYVNLSPQNTLSNMPYDSINPYVLNEVKQFLKQCQVNQSSFNFEANQCLHIEKNPYFNFQYKNYKSTTGFSEEIFNFFKIYPNNQPFGIKHLMNGRKRKLVYLDSFIALKNNVIPRYKETVLRFYEAMLSEEVLDIYTLGKYTKSKRMTYLIPPTKSQFKKIKANNSYYQKYYDELSPDKSELIPVFQKEFINGNQNLFNQIMKELSKTTTQ